MVVTTAWQKKLLKKEELILSGFADVQFPKQLKLFPKTDKGFPQKPLKSSSIARKDDKKNHKGRRRSSLKNLLADSELDTL